MYNMLIVDDERAITDGLYDFFKNDADVELNLYKAYSAFQALELMDRVKTDIILSDINMPGMDGLEMQSRIIKKWFRCKMIFITGYNEFEYARTAIKNNSVDYILKTEGDEAILCAVKRAMELLDHELNNEELLKNAQNKLAEALPLLKERLVNELLEGVADSQTDLSDKFRELKIPLSPDRDVMILEGIIENIDIEKDIIGRSKAVNGIQNIFEEYFSDAVSILSSSAGKNKILWLLQPADISENHEEYTKIWGRICAILKDSLETVQTKCKELYQASVSFFCDEEPCTWNELSIRFDRLNIFAGKHLGHTKEVIFFETGFREERVSGDGGNFKDDYEIQLQIKRISVLEAYLESGQEAEFKRLFVDIVTAIKDRKLISFGLKLEVYYSISHILLSYINKQNIFEKVKERVNIAKLLNPDFNSSEWFVPEYFLELSEILFVRKIEEQIKNANRIVEDMKGYIQQNLHGDLSMVRLSELTHYNSSYLSRLFKNITGESISDYIWRVKMSKAMEMLMQRDIKINEIALSLGFESAAYFTKFFKKFENKTPQEFREGL